MITQGFTPRFKEEAAKPIVGRGYGVSESRRGRLTETPIVLLSTSTSKTWRCSSSYRCLDALFLLGHRESSI